MAAIAIMVKPKKKQMDVEVEEQGSALDKAVASPYKMAMAAKEEAAEVAKKKAKYAATAMKAIDGFKGTK